MNLDILKNLNYPEEFEYAVSFVLAHEGGYVNDKDDPGGETKYGISKKSFPKIDIKNLTLDGAISIYYKHYYEFLDSLFDFSGFDDEKIGKIFALLVFDSAVQHGRHRTIKFIQTAIKLYTDIIVDGVAGPITISKLDEVLNDVPFSSFASALLGIRLRFYTDIVRHRPRSRKYLAGWVNRVSDICMLIAEFRN